MHTQNALDMSSACYETNSHRALVSCIVYVSNHVKQLSSKVFEVGSRLGIFQIQCMNWRQYAFGMSNTFCELDSPRAPSISKHKPNLCHAQFAWRPKWATAEQVHKGAHTYKPYTMHCVHAPHAQSRTVLRTSHMDACAIQCAHSLFNTHVRLETKSNSM